MPAVKRDVIHKPLAPPLSREREDFRRQKSEILCLLQCVRSYANENPKQELTRNRYESSETLKMAGLFE